MNKFKSIVAIAVIGSLTLAGCGTSSSTTTVSGTTHPSATSQSSSPSVKEGVAKLLSDAKQLKKAIAAGDAAGIQTKGPKLEETWKTFEDSLKAQYPDYYDKIEKPLNPAVAGSKAASVDKDTLLKLDNELIDVLYDLSQKLIPTEQVKTGVQKMIDATNELKTAISAGDEAKVKQLAPTLEDTWKTFEDGVRPRGADDYEAIEKSLNPEVAGSSATPLDKQTLGKLNDDLNKALTDFLKKLQ